MIIEAMTSEDVAAWFRCRCAAKFDYPRTIKETEFFVSETSLAVQPFAFRVWVAEGRPPKPTIRGIEDESWTENTVQVWDLKDFPQGSLIWRVSKTKTLHVFRRMDSGDDWEHARLEPGDGTYPTDWGTFIPYDGDWWLAATR